MIENALAWGSLLVWILSGNPLYLIATGVFAVAARIYATKGGDK